MNPDHPNVLFLTFEALRHDRASLTGYDRPTTPFLEKLGEEAIVCEENISLGAFTQPALPSMLTSTRPLSYGGYDNGAWGRPPSVFKIFSDAGYDVATLPTFPRVNHFYGYGDGVNREYLLFVINSLVGIASQAISSALRAYHEGTLSDEGAVEKTSPVITKLFDDLDTYCDYRIENRELDRTDLSGERLLRDGYDFRRIKKIIARHRAEFHDSAIAYIKRHLGYVPKAHEWISADWRYTRHLPALFRIGFLRILEPILYPFAPSRAKLLDYSSKRYVDTAAVINRMIHVIDTRDRSKPFFIWTHLFDTHVPYCPGVGGGWPKEMRSYMEALGYSPNIDPAIAVSGKPQTPESWEAWSALYDGTVLYIDTQIGRALAMLEERGLADDTLVVVASDHGEELGEHGDISHHFRMYEHNIRAPMLFHRRGMKGQRIRDLTTSMDLPPTLASLAGLDPHPAWEGKAVTDPAVSRRTHVMAESFHGGSCLFESRPPYIAVRTQRYKYLWKEYRDPLDAFSAEGLELFDHLEDPLEQNNLYRPDHPALTELNPVVAERLAEIPEISDERIVTAFGSVGEDALKKIRGAGRLKA